MMISIIIPTYDESTQIAATLSLLAKNCQDFRVEIIIADGGSTDDTVSIALSLGATVIHTNKKGRAAQMNQGVATAKYEILYFLHADSVPPENFIMFIQDAINKNAVAGCFRLAFDEDHWFLKANAWFTRFNVNAVRFGDQSLFARKDIFQRSGGFKESLILMEDQEIIHRLKKFGKFKVMPAYIVTSARKYRANGIYRMQAVFFRIWLLYYLGYSQQKLLTLYQRLIRK